MNNQLKKLGGVLTLLKNPTIICSADLKRRLVGVAKTLSIPPLKLAVIDELVQYEPNLMPHEAEPGDLALLLLTSGSTGTPKLVMQTHAALQARCVATAAMNRITPDDTSLNWLPLDHVGGIVMFHLRDVFVGCRQIHLPTGNVLRDPLLWMRLVDRFRVTATWAPNFAYSLVTNQLKHQESLNWDLSCLRFILNAGEAIVSRQARRFMRDLAVYGLPEYAMHPAWGMSETCSAVTFHQDWRLSNTDDSDQWVVVGNPIPGISLRIVDAENRLVPEGKTGQLQVMGASVLRGYFQNEEANKTSFTEDGWFCTGDWATLQEGNLSITGRMKDVIIINGLNFYSHEIESSVEEVLGVESSFTAAVGVNTGKDSTDGLVIFFHPSAGLEADVTGLLKEIRAKIVNDLGINPTHMIPIERNEIPKTEIGKIQRGQLKQRYENGEFIQRAKQQDTPQPSWFFRKRWRRREFFLLENRTEQGVTLIFADEDGLAEEVAMAQPWRTHVLVRPGTLYSRQGDHQYSIQVDNYAHYSQVLIDSADLGRVEKVFHLWGLDAKPGPINQETLDRAQHQGVISLLNTAKALNQVQGKMGGVHLVFATFCGAGLAGETPNMTHAAAGGMLKTIHAEMPWLRTHHVDLEPGFESNAFFLMRELEALNMDRDIAYRNGCRYVAGLEDVDLPKKAIHNPPLVHNGFYAITGGLGGVARHIAHFLARKYGARLLLLGRSALAKDDERHHHLEQLEKMGASVIYAPVDVADEQGLREAIQAAEAHFCRPLNGVFHLAGLLTEGMVGELTEARIKENLTSKMWGSLLLNKILEERQDTLFVNFSSVNGFFGGTGAGAYAAGNSFQDLFASYQQARGKVKGYCFAWSIWDETGMSLGFGARKDLALVRGFQTMSPGRAIYSTMAGLCHHEPHLLIGLDGKNRYIQAFLDQETQGVMRLKLYYGGTPLRKDVLSGINWVDRLGNPLDGELFYLEEFPLNPSGKPDRKALEKRLAGGHSNVGDGSHAEGPERVIAQIWCEVLDLPEVGLDENLFDLGGNSLLMTKMQNLIKARLKREVTVVELFRYPTVATLGRFLKQTHEGVSTTRDVVGAIWAEVLNTSELGHHANFFELGGHSLLMGQIQKRLESRFHVSLTLIDLFRHPTIHNLAQHLETLLLQTEQTSMADQVSHIWEDVLKTPNIDPQANFFELGGHSLLLGKIQQRIKETFDLELSLVDLFRNPTINLLAQYLKTLKPVVNDLVEALPNQIKAIWGEVLQFPIHDLDANFFDLGGHSLSMNKVQQVIEERIKLQVSLNDLFRYPTINTLAAFLATGGEARSQVGSDSGLGQTQAKSAVALRKQRMTRLAVGRNIGR